MSLTALPLGMPVRLEDGGAGVVVVRTSEGVHAFDDVCPHARYRLSDGDVVDGEIECPGHGWRFALQDGQCSTVPAYCAVARRVVIIGDHVRIEPHATAPSGEGPYVCLETGL